MHVRQGRRATKEGSCGPVHSPMSIPRPHEQNTKQQTKPKPQKEQTHKHKNQQTKKKTTEKTGHEGIAIRLRNWLRWHLVCHALHRPWMRNKPTKNKQQKQDGHRRWEKQQSTLRKPRMPPARIPKMTMCSHSGITSHLCTTKQTPTTPGRNEVVKMEKVKQAVKMI